MVIGLLAAVVSLGVLTVGTATTAEAKPKPGAKCKKIGKTTSNGLICKRKNGKKVFVRIPAAQAPTTPAPDPATGATSPEFTAAEKETIKASFNRALPGQQVDRTFTEGGSLTQVIWHFCPGNRYGLVSNLSFSGRGSTTATEIGTWTIVEAGGIRDVAEAVLIQLRPDDPSLAASTLELAAFADGRIEANGRRAVVSPSSEC